MAIQLFKVGKGYKLPDGRECQFKVFDEFSYTDMLKSGWHLNPDDCFKPEKKEPNEVAEETKEPEVCEDNLIVVAKKDQSASPQKKVRQVKPRKK